MYHMKAYVADLFGYDKFASQVILKVMIQAGNPRRPAELLAHILAVQDSWLSRCKGVAPEGHTFWPEPDVAAFANDVVKHSQGWLDFIAGLEPLEFEKTISYTNTKGDVFENKLIDIITQVTNHGTHHRAQIGQHLKAAGIDPLPNTDYINYIRYIKAGNK
jgi:uncharacterized damage-inducible protein DinB